MGVLNSDISGCWAYSLTKYIACTLVFLKHNCEPIEQPMDKKQETMTT